MLSVRVFFLNNSFTSFFFPDCTSRSLMMVSLYDNLQICWSDSSYWSAIAKGLWDTWWIIVIVWFILPRYCPAADMWCQNPDNRPSLDTVLSHRSILRRLGDSEGLAGNVGCEGFYVSRLTFDLGLTVIKELCFCSSVPYFSPSTIPYSVTAEVGREISYLLPFHNAQHGTNSVPPSHQLLPSHTPLMSQRDSQRCHQDHSSLAESNSTLRTKALPKTGL